MKSSNYHVDSVDAQSGARIRVHCQYLSDVQDAIRELAGSGCFPITIDVCRCRSAA